jgi:hypothetical protein
MKAALGLRFAFGLAAFLAAFLGAAFFAAFLGAAFFAGFLAAGFFAFLVAIFFNLDFNGISNCGDYLTHSISNIVVFNIRRFIGKI